MLTDFHQTKH